MTYPYLLLVSSAATHDGEPQINAAPAIPARERSVLGLRVHAYGRSTYAETCSNTRISIERGMRLLNGFEEGKVVQ